MRFTHKHIFGEINLSDAGIIEGYVYSTESNGRSLAVDILLDDFYLDTVLCSLPKSIEVGKKKMIAKAGFVQKVSRHLLKASDSISMHLTNTEEVLFKGAIGDLLKEDTKIKGLVHYDGGLTLSGWAINLKNPSKTLEVTFTEKERLVGKVMADQAYAHGSIQYLKHGFSYTLPFEYLDGREHHIKVLVDGKELENSPVVVRSMPQTLSEFLQNKQRITNEMKDFLIEYLRDYESIVQRHVDFSLHEKWKGLFCRVKVEKETNHKVYTIDLSKDNTPYAVEKAVKVNPKHLLIFFNEVSPEKGVIDHFIDESIKSKADLAYGDEDLLFKPSFDPYLFFEYDYLGDILYVEGSLLKRALSNFGMPSNPLELRTFLVLEALRDGTVAHVPYPLCNKKPNPTFDSSKQRQKILNDWANRHRINLSLKQRQEEGLLKAQKGLTRHLKVSIIIPTKDKLFYLKRCIESIKKKTSYEDLELIIVDNDSEEKKTIDYLRSLTTEGVKIIEFKETYNYSKINNRAVKQAKGDIICLLNNDTEVLTSDWIHTALSFFEDETVAIVGAKLIWPNDFVQHGGVIIGASGLAAHVGNQWHKDERGYMNRNLLTGSWSAVTAACMFVRKDIYLDLNGLDEVEFPVAFNDTDFCLRVVQKGHNIIFSPDILLRHYESVSRGKDERIYQKFRAQREMDAFRHRWGSYEDPYYNPNLSLSSFLPPFYGLALPNRPRRTRLWQKR